MEMILCFLFGLAIGSILTAPARRKRFETDIQEEIEIEALKRKAEGLNRKGDEKTEIGPFMEGVGYDIRKRFNLPPNSNPTPAQLKIVKPPAPPPPARRVKSTTLKPAPCGSKAW